MVDYTLPNHQDDWGNYPTTKALAIQENNRREYDAKLAKKAARKAKIRSFFTKK